MHGSVIIAGVAILALVALVATWTSMVLLPAPGSDLTGQEALKRFSSCEELETFLEDKSDSYGNMLTGLPMAGARMDTMEALGAPTMAAGAGADKIQSEDYSTTNVQVEGVDEADIIKSDGKYLYILSGGKIVIVDAYPAENASILSETNISGIPSEIFINGDRLVVFTQGGWNNYWIAKDNSYSGPVSSVLVYDVTDRSDPVLKRNLTLEGNYYDSRMIGDYVYTISTKHVSSWTEPGIPRITDAVAGQAEESKPACNCSEVYYFDVPDSSYQFTTVTSLNIMDDNSVEQSKVFLMGYSQNIFVSQNNIYITYQKRVDYNDMFFRAVNEIIIPNLPIGESSKVSSVMSSNLTEWEKQREISKILEGFIGGMDPEQGAQFMKDFQAKVDEFFIKISKEMEQSVIHRVSISNGNIEYAAGGAVPGRILNQFSMDEYNGYFRVATTTGNLWFRGTRSETMNHVYVLDANMNTVGRLENMAKGESIYSVRFLGDRAYMVTFERIDPLFVIDLSVPTNPNVLGELKIPGYSDYLHPYDENHIIGLGMDTEENRWGGISTSGVKISLFDVSDVANPKEVSNYVIGGRGSYSIATHEHKAFLFDKDKELLVIPARTYDGVSNEKDYWNRYWHGAYVFQINLEEGISLRGRIAHQVDSNETESWYDYQHDVKRSMYMDDVLYTLSNAMVKMNSLINLEEINSVDLPAQDQWVRPYPIPMMEEPIGIGIEDIEVLI